MGAGLAPHWAGIPWNHVACHSWNPAGAGMFRSCVSFLGLRSKVAQAGWLKTTEIYSLTVLEARSLTSRCWQDHDPSEISRAESFLPLPVCGWQSLELNGSYIEPLPSVSSPLLIRTLVILQLGLTPTQYELILISVAPLCWWSLYLLIHLQAKIYL